MKEIYLNEDHNAIVSDEDYDKIISHKYKWSLSVEGNGYKYAVAKFYVDGKRRNVRMHRFIMEVSNPKIFVDHKDGNGLNNTRENLRVCTPSQNCINSRKIKGKIPYKGVTLSKGKFYRAVIRGEGRSKIHIGNFNTPEEAAKAYDVYAVRKYGEFAVTNFDKIDESVLEKRRR